MAKFHIEDHTAEVIKAKNEAVERALTAIGLQAVGYAIMKAPVDTGLLRNSLTFALNGKSPQIDHYKADKGNEHGAYKGTAPDEGDAVYIGTNVEYAPYVEFGTRLTKAQEFLKPAVLDHLDEYERIAEKSLKGE